jgi:hypothetical protein
LQGEKQISTFSEGVEPFRNVVISFKKDQQDKTGDRTGESSRTYSKPRTYNRQGTKPQAREN